MAPRPPPARFGLLTQAGPQGFSIVDGGWPPLVDIPGQRVHAFNVTGVGQRQSIPDGVVIGQQTAIYALWVWTQGILDPGNVGFAFGSEDDFIADLPANAIDWFYPYRAAQPWQWRFLCDRERFIFQVQSDGAAQDFYSQAERIR